MREDPDQIEGGSFLVRVSKALCSFYWEALCTNLVCENFDPDVVGAIISAKNRYYNIHLWHKTADNEELRMKICKEFCELLKFPIGLRIDYTSHKSVLNSGETGKQTIHFILELEGPVVTAIPGREAQGRKQGGENQEKAEND